MKWSATNISLFLQVYQQFPALWNIKHKDYTNKPLKDTGFKQLMSELEENQLLGQMDEKQLKSKIKSLKDVYRTELNKIEKSKKSGCGTDDVYVPKLTWFNDGSFLSEVLATRGGTSNLIGFLIGEKYSVTTQTVSDAEMEEEKIETTINVSGTFAVGLPLLLCKPLGRIDEESLKEILESCEKDVLGWYSFRRNSSQGPTMRETILHKELCKTFTHVPPQYFLFCIITTSDTDGNATYSHKFTFSTLNRRMFIPVSVVETNLGEPEDNVYRRSTVVDTSFKHLQQVLHSLNGVNSSKVTMSTLHTEINKHIDFLEGSVSKLQAEADSYINRVNSSNRNLSVVDQKSSRRDESTPSTSAKLKPDELSVEY